MVMIYGQLVIGPPGSGKTTYCDKMSTFLTDLGRKVSIINLDPANENMKYVPTIDISHLIKLDEVMSHHKLGPNGALMYCMEFLKTNISWLIDKLKNIENTYLIIDCPGQVELYAHDNSMSSIIQELDKNSLKLCTVHLIDSHHCSDPGKYLSTLILCTTVMLKLGLPHVNILSKFDRLKKYSNLLTFNLDFYTEVLDLKYLLDRLQEDRSTSKYKKLNEALIGLIEDYSLVTFFPLDVEDKKLLFQLKSAIDKANGYVFKTDEPRDIQSLLMCAVGAISDTEKYSTIEHLSI